MRVWWEITDIRPKVFNFRLCMLDVIT